MAFSRALSKYLTVLLAVLQIIKGNSLVLFLGIIYLKIIQYFSFTSAILIKDRKNLNDYNIAKFFKAI